MCRSRKIFLSFVLAVALHGIFVQARPGKTPRQSWLPPLPSLPSWAAVTAQLPSWGSIQPLFSPGGTGGVQFAPALADMGSYLSNTMPSFGNMYASIPSWEELGSMLPNLPRPSAIFNRLPQEMQASLENMWAQTNPLDVDSYKRKHYKHGSLLLLGLAGFYSHYQGRYKQHRKGIENFIDPHARKQKYNEMKTVCYYTLPWSKEDNHTLMPADIKPGLCTHLVVENAVVSGHTGLVSMVHDEIDDHHLKEMLGKLKDAAPKVLLRVKGFGSDAHKAVDPLQFMAQSKKKRHKFIRSSMGLVRRYGLAGIDIDWRSGWRQSVHASFLADLAEEYRAYFDPWGNALKEEGDKAGPLKEMVLTVTVPGWPSYAFHPHDVRRLVDHVDWITVRAFELPGPSPHGTILSKSPGRGGGINAARSVMAWTQRGIPHEKVVLGVPLFGENIHLTPHHGLSAHASSFQTTEHSPVFTPNELGVDLHHHLSKRSTILGGRLQRRSSGLEESLGEVYDRRMMPRTSVNDMWRPVPQSAHAPVDQYDSSAHAMLNQDGMMLSPVEMPQYFQQQRSAMQMTSGDLQTRAPPSESMKMPGPGLMQEKDPEALQKAGHMHDFGKDNTQNTMADVMREMKYHSEMTGIPSNDLRGKTDQEANHERRSKVSMYRWEGTDASKEKSMHGSYEAAAPVFKPEGDGWVEEMKPTMSQTEKQNGGTPMAMTGGHERKVQGEGQGGDLAGSMSAMGEEEKNQVPDDVMMKMMMEMIAKEQGMMQEGQKMEEPNGAEKAHESDEGTKGNDEAAASEVDDVLEIDLSSHVSYGQICRLLQAGRLFLKQRTPTGSCASDGLHWISFQDQHDIALTARWAEDAGLGGVALFSLNDDDWKGKCDPNGTPFVIARKVWKIIG